MWHRSITTGELIVISQFFMLLFIFLESWIFNRFVSCQNVHPHCIPKRWDLISNHYYQNLNSLFDNKEIQLVHVFGFPTNFAENEEKFSKNQSEIPMLVSNAHFKKHLVLLFWIIKTMWLKKLNLLIVSWRHPVKTTFQGENFPDTSLLETLVAIRAVFRLGSAHQSLISTKHFR